MKAKMIFLVLIAVGSQLYAQQGWQYQNSNLIGNQHGAICALTKDMLFVIASEGKFLKTMDGGASWIELNTGFTESFFDVAFSPAGFGYAVGQNGLIIKTMDGGVSWTVMASGTNEDLFSICLYAPSDVWVVGDNGVILHSVDHGNTWIKNTSLTNKRLNSIAFKSAGNGYIAGNLGTLLGTTDGGATWNTLAIPTDKDLYSLSVRENFTRVLAGNVAFYLYDSNEMFESADGFNWTSINMESLIPGRSRMCFSNDSVGFTLSSNCTTNGECGIGITRTTDYGATWATSFDNWNPPSMVGLAYGDMIFVSDSIGYVLCGNNILKTTDQGTLVSIKELNRDLFFSVFPNPVVSGNLTIELNQTSLMGLSVEICNMRGNLLLTRYDPEKINSIDVSQFPGGVYYVKLKQDNRDMGVRKFVKLQ
jgi:photosystem II stability/assembly factor-like uncharacterized protein